ncbi:MAG: adenine phosphoribosyltransferase [Chloroflexota bacterium]
MDAQLAPYIRDVPDFPVQGILFKDITPLLRDPSAFKLTVDALAARFRDTPVDLVAAIESRGFIFGAPIAYQLGAGLVPIRKPGKLPWETRSVEYSLEYGTNTLQAHVDAVKPGARVLLVDDLLATGGSAKAAIQLIEGMGGVVVAAAFCIELAFLHGRDRLAGYRVDSLITF